MFHCQQVSRHNSVTHGPGEGGRPPWHGELLGRIKKETVVEDSRKEQEEEGGDLESKFKEMLNKTSSPAQQKYVTVAVASTDSCDSCSTFN